MKYIFLTFIFIEFFVVYTRIRVQLGCYSTVVNQGLLTFDSGRHYESFRQSSGSSDGWGPGHQKSQKTGETTRNGDPSQK